MSSYSLIKRIRAFGTVKDEFQAYLMQEDGKIAPAFIEGKPLFDILNSDGVDWFIELYKKKYLIPMKGLYKGYIFDEDLLSFLRNRKNGDYFDYRKIPTFSPKVLELWKEYCLRNNVRHNEKVVDRFPVHSPDMEKNGSGKTQYFVGYNVPERLIYGQKFKDLPKSIGVWEHWFNFVNKLFFKKWIEKITKKVKEINSDNKNFYGVGCLSFFEWNLPYEYLEDEDFIVSKSLWGACDKQRYADITMIAKSKYLDFIICETYPPLDNKKYQGKIFGDDL